MRRRATFALLVFSTLAFAGSAAAAGPLTVASSVHPASARVGEPLTLTVEARGDPDVVAVGTIQVDLRAGALTPIGAATVTRSGEVVRVEQRLACLDARCVPRDGARVLELPGARARATRVGGGAVNGAAAPVSVSVVPTATPKDVQGAPASLRREVALPPVEYDIAPGRLAWLLDLGAALLVVVAIAVLAPELKALRNRRAAATADPLARALRLLRESATRDGADRRLALDLLATELKARVVESDDSTVAATLAWSPSTPGRAEVEALAGVIEQHTLEHHPVGQRVRGDE
jgi:hypothetical protein